MPKKTFNRLKPLKDSLKIPKSEVSPAKRCQFKSSSPHCFSHWIFPVSDAFIQWNSTGSFIFSPSYLHPQRMKLSNIPWDAVSVVSCVPWCEGQIKADVVPADVGLDPVVLLLSARFCLFPASPLLYIIFCALLQKTASSQYF